MTHRVVHFHVDAQQWDANTSVMDRVSDRESAMFFIGSLWRL